MKTSVPSAQADVKDNKKKGEIPDLDFLWEEYQKSAQKEAEYEAQSITIYPSPGTSMYLLFIYLYI